MHLQHPPQQEPFFKKYLNVKTRMVIIVQIVNRNILFGLENTQQSSEERKLKSNGIDAKRVKRHLLTLRIQLYIELVVLTNG